MDSSDIRSGLYRDLSREHGFEPLKVEGRLPDDLAGTLYRNGPGAFGAFGRRYHHLLDPATGEPRRTLSHSLTVAAADCMTADAAATALFGMTRRDAVERLRAVAPAAEIVPA